MATLVVATAPGGARRRWLPMTVIAMVAVLTGAASYVVEVGLGTINGYLLGNGIAELGLAVGVTLVALGIGAYLQRFVSNGLLLGMFIIAELVLAMMSGFAPFALKWLFVASPENFNTVKIAYIGAVGIIIGAEAPVMARLNERFNPTLKDNLAKIWALDGLGGALGVTLWYLMVGKVSVYAFCYSVAAANIAVAVLLLLTFGGKFSWPKQLGYACAVVLTIMSLLGGFTRGNSWEQNANQALYDAPIIHQEMSRYQQVTMTRGPHPSDSSSHDYRLYLNGNLQFSSADEAIYHENLVHPAMNVAAARERVLILGGGDGLALREVLKYPDVKEVSLVDLDPAIIQLATRDPVLSALNKGSFQDARVHASLSAGVQSTGERQQVFAETGKSEVIDGHPTSLTESIGSVDIYTVDADQFMSESQQPWDVIIIDLPDPNSVELAKLYSQEFYAKVKDALAADGVMVVQSGSPYHAPETFMCIQRTLAQAGFDTVPYHENVPSFGDWGWWIASNSLSADKLHERLEGLRTFGVETEKVSARHMQRSLMFMDGWSDVRSTEVSTLMRPEVFRLYVYEGWKVN